MSQDELAVLNGRCNGGLSARRPQFPSCIRNVEIDIRFGAIKQLANVFGCAAPGSMHQALHFTLGEVTHMIARG